jgi:hypothetical protein
MDTRWPATVSEPVRAGPFVDATEKASWPGPFPAEEPWMVIQSAWLAAVHPQPAAAFTETPSWPPAASIVCVAGSTWKVQPPAWTTVKSWPAMTAVPVRCGPLLDGTVSVTVPGPEPAWGLMPIHGTLLAAVHGHPAPLDTATLAEPPPGDRSWAFLSIAYVQPCDCVTLNRCPAIVSVPARGGPVVAATEIASGPLPLPVDDDVIWIHDESEVAVHEHRGLDACTSIRAVPPADEKSADGDDRVMMHSPAACVICARELFTMIAPVRACGSGFAPAANSTVPSP